MPRLDRRSKRLMSGPRTVTAAAIPGKTATCGHCGKQSPANVPPEKMWGIDVNGITTSKVGFVDHWCCERCFVAGGKAVPA